MKPMTETHLAILRRHMVEIIGIHADLMSDEIGKPMLDPRILSAILRVPRHLFVPAPLAAVAYHDTPLPIGFDKTVSQPFISALMTNLLAPAPNDSILEIGTGLGYQAAVLAELAAQVWTVEIVEEFANSATLRLQQLGYDNVTVRVGDGSRGWAEHAPFDKILVTAAVGEPPRVLVEQLKPEGRMVLPIGPEDTQQLTVIDKAADGQLTTREIIPVRFTQLETVL